MDTVHYFPPFHASEHTIGEQYFFLSTPSNRVISVEVLDNLGNLITSVNISNAAPQSFFLGTDNSSRAMTEAPELGVPLSNKGYILRADSPFYCNYRVYAYPQSGSITCKGTQAIGRRFRPGNMINSLHFSNRSNSVSIFAVEDTRITIRDLPADLELHNLNVTNGTLDFTLSKGETIVLTAFLNILAPNNVYGFLGSLIESSGDIVVNCGSYTGGNVTFTDSRDIGFDQIVPMSNAGHSFIAIRGNGLDLMENIIVVIDKDNTEVKVNGLSLGSYQAGEYLVLEEFLYTPQENMFIECSEPVVLYQMIGGFTHYPTYGMNFIPSLNCLADTAVNNIPFYNRVGNFSYNGYIIIVARAGARVEKNGVALPVGLANPVAGNADYVTYKLSDDFLSDHLSIESDQEVQVGLIGANGAVGFAAYFSGFATQPQTGFLNLSADEGICVDTLRSSGNYNGIEWYYNDTLVAVDVDSLISRGAGEYYLVGYYGRCIEVKDTSFVYTFQEPDTVYIQRSSCNPLDTGFFVFNDQTAFECDSVTLLAVDYLRSDTIISQYYTCDQDLASEDTSFLVNISGCDSLRISRYSYVGLDSIFIRADICEGEVYPFEGGNYSASGRYCMDYLSEYSCDSIRCLQLKVTPNYSSYLQDTICSYEQYYFEGRTLNQSGLYVERYQGIVHCDSLISVQLTVLDAPLFEVPELPAYCDGDSIGVELTYHPYEIEWEDDFEGESRYFSEGASHRFRLISPFSCTYEYMLEVPSPIKIEGLLEEVSDYNGYEISCFGADDGYIEVDASGALGAHYYSWSSGQTEGSIQGLSAGVYQVLIYDENNCTDSLSIHLEEPDPLFFELETEDINCQNDLGSLVITALSGSVPEYEFYLNGVITDTAIWNLLAGIYELEIRDKNNCIAKEQVEIFDTHDTLLLNIVGPDSIRLGEKVEFNFQSSDPMVEWNWSSLEGGDCSNCWQYQIYPSTGGVLILEGLNERGCWGRAVHPYIVYYPKSVYIPNIFSPNGDGRNDVFIVHANPAVEIIRSYQIFDRWGELIFENYDLEPNVPVGYWTGSFLGQAMNPAVFVYVVEVEYIDGRRAQFAGDITLIR